MAWNNLGQRFSYMRVREQIVAEVQADLGATPPPAGATTLTTVKLSQAAYDALGTKDANVLYVIV